MYGKTFLSKFQFNNQSCFFLTLNIKEEIELFIYIL